MVVVIHRQWEGVLLQEVVAVVIHRQWEGVLFQEVVVALGVVALRRLERIRRWWQGFLLQATIWLQQNSYRRMIHQGVDIYLALC